MIYDMTKRSERGFVDDVRQIRYVRFFKYTSNSEITVDFTKLPNIANIDQSFEGTSFTKITITPPDHNISAQKTFHQNSNLTHIVILGELKFSVNSSAYEGFAGNNPKLVSISGILNFANQTRAGIFNGTTNINAFFKCEKLEDVTFAENVMPMTTTDWNLSWLAALSDDSLISIANTLKDTYTGTITFHATPKARLSTIMGNVSEVTVEGVTYHRFTANQSGSVTLINFLTQTKGATIA